MPNPSRDPQSLRRHILLRVLAGSRSYGTNIETSDHDFRGVYLPPADLEWSLQGAPEQLEFKSGNTEEVYWELGKFLRLALQNNPNILEVLWSPVLETTPLGDELRTLRGAVLSRRVEQTYGGYVKSQRELLLRRLRVDGELKPKHGMHLLRLLYAGAHALRTGEVLVHVGPHLPELMEVRSGAWPLERIIGRAEELEADLAEAARNTILPEQPDVERVEAFLLKARRAAL
jgi:predicted nucleotidyltransferase